MAGVAADGHEMVLCEMKFYAGLTQNQPKTYLERLQKNGGCGLVFVCPKARQTSLWAKLQDLYTGKIAFVNDHCVRVDDVYMAIITWAEVLEMLYHTGVSSAKEYLSDIQQLKGYCEQMDSDAFIPFRAEDLTAEVAKKTERYYEVIDETANMLCADRSVRARPKGKASSCRMGYERKIEIDGILVYISYDRNLWRSDASLETPFWVSFNSADWQKTELAQAGLAKIPAHKKDNTVWNMCYLALEPLTDAVFEDVCRDLKKQILKYIDLFRTTI